MTIINDFKEKKKEYKDFIKKVKKTAFLKEIKGLFENQPTIEGFRWQQFTPSFNDGDPCVFTMSNFYVKSFGFDEGGDNDDGYLDYYDNAAQGDHDAKNFIEDLGNILGDCDDLLLALFGDNKQITVTRKGFEVDDYESY